jgi:ABC-type antimicrobial peptide transport system permease subunit
VGRKVAAILLRRAQYSDAVRTQWSRLTAYAPVNRRRFCGLLPASGGGLPTRRRVCPARAESRWTPETLAVRYSGTGSFAVKPVIDAINEIDPEQPVAAVQTMEEVVTQAVAGRGNQMSLMTAFAGLAFVLAVLGIYAVLSYRVSLRRREVGVRIALGARQSQVAGGVVLDGLAVTAAGLAIGSVGAVAFGTAMSSVLYRVSPYHAATYIAVLAIFTLAAIFAAWIPARRAASVAPAVVLRDE